MTYDNNFGNVRVGTVVITCPQISVPIPKNRHHSHCSRVSSLVENAILPYWMMTTCCVERGNVMLASLVGASEEWRVGTDHIQFMEK